MKIKLITLSIMAFAICSAFAQEERTLMNKDEMDVFAEQINELVLANRYEEALFIYDANRQYVNPKLLCRQDRGWWKETSADLDERLATFRRNRELIQEAEETYDAHEYRRCYDILQTMNCDSTNVYRESLAMFIALRDSMDNHRVMLQHIESHVDEYIADFKAKRYDKLFEMLQDDYVLGYVPTDKLPEMREVVGTLNTMLTQEPEKIVMSDIVLSRKQLLSACHTDLSKLLYALQLDVIHYYSMLFDTEQQIANYKKSDEYAAKLAELEKAKEKALHTLYAHTQKANTGPYNSADSCFYVLIGSNNGVNLTYFNFATADPPRAFGERFQKVVHEALPIKTTTDKTLADKYRNGNHFVQHFLAIPMSAETARHYENMDCRIVICFIPAGMREYSFEGAELQTANGAYDIFNAHETLPYSTRCRLMLYTNDGKLIYDKILEK